MANMNEFSGAIKGRNPLSTQCMPSFSENELREAAIWIEKGKYVPKKSFPSIAGTAPDKEATGLKLSSDLERLSGIVVHGDAWEPGEYTVKDSEIELSGYGCSDFTARGAGATVFGGGTLNLENVTITTRGATRCATIATQNATLRASNCRFASYGGPLPSDYEPVIGPGMMTPPWPLKLDGSCRTHLSMDGSRTFFDHCDIYAAAWGAVSTDSSGGCLYLECSDCNIEVEGNGYGTYADKGCHNVFKHCRIHSGNMLAIEDGNCSVTCIDTEGDCEKNGFMIHGGFKDYVDATILDIEGGSYHAKENVILAKSACTDIYVKNARLQSDSGVILKSMCNDDPMYYEMAVKGDSVYGVQATFEAMEINGSICHEDTDRRMRISLVDATLHGAVTGEPVLNLYGRSRWYADADSSVKMENPLELAQLDAAPGVVIRIKAEKNCILSGQHDLPSGGSVIFC